MMPRRPDGSPAPSTGPNARTPPKPARLAPPGQGRPPSRPTSRPTLRIFTTTLWEYPSQHYDAPSGERMQGDRDYIGATPSWVIWQLLQRYTRPGDLVIDPMCGSGTTLDVAADLGRRALGYDLRPPPPVPGRPPRPISRADARALPLESGVADFIFVDPPYSTHVDYSDDPRCIGKLDAAGPDGGQAYFAAMEEVIAQMHRVLRHRRYAALYVSDSWRKRKSTDPGRGAGIFMPIGFRLFAMLQQRFTPVDIIAVVRHNQKLQRGNWHKAAEEGNFFLRGFNYLFIMRKEDGGPPAQAAADEARSTPDLPRARARADAQPRGDAPPGANSNSKPRGRAKDPSGRPAGPR